MKKFLLIGTLYLITTITFPSCEWQKTPVLAIKNNTNFKIIGTAMVNDSLTDSLLYTDKVLINIYDDPGESQDIGIKGFKFNNKNDSSKLYLYFLNFDIIKKYRSLKIQKGIVAKSLIRKQIIQLKTVKSFDTLFLKQLAPLSNEK